MDINLTVKRSTLFILDNADSIMDSRIHNLEILRAYIQASSSAKGFALIRYAGK